MASSPSENPSAEDRSDKSANPNSRSSSRPSAPTDNGTSAGGATKDSTTGRPGTQPGQGTGTKDATSGRSGTRPPTKGGADGTTPEEVTPVGHGPAVWIGLVIGAIVLVLLLIFVIQNQGTASFEYFAARFELPLGVAMLLAAVAGALIMALVGSVRMIQMSLTMRKMRKQLDKIKQNLKH